MSVRVVFDISQVASLGGRFDDLVRRAGNMQPAMEEIGAALRSSTLRRFETQSDPEGRKWASLSADTILGRLGGVKRVYTRKMKFRKGVAKRMASLKILQHKGHLRNSITYRATRVSVEVGTAMVYGRIHQFGGNAGRGKKIRIPARPYLGISGGDKGAIRDAVAHHFSGVFK